MDAEQALDKSSEAKMPARLLVALLLVYILWGSTYLAIAVAIETIPPLFMAASRFLVAGGVLFLYMRFVKGERIQPGVWGPACLMGFLLLLLGNGGVVYAEQYVPSGATALLVGSGPFWFVLLAWLWLKGPRPGPKAIVGLLLGFIGLVALIGPGQLSDKEVHIPLWPSLLVVFSALSWSIGSIYSKTLKVQASPLMMSGLQMLAGFVYLTIAGFANGEHHGFQLSAVSAHSWAAWAYLVVAGSLIGFTAYIYVLRHATPAVASTYAYVNPVVAVIFGWAAGGEALTWSMVFAGSLIVGAVILISWPVRRSPAAGPSLVTEETAPEHS